MVERRQLRLSERSREGEVPLQREFCGFGIEGLAIVEFDAGPQLDRDLPAVIRKLMRQRELWHDVELLVDIEQLVAERCEHDAADIGARHGRVEDIGVLGKPNSQRGLGVDARSERQQQRRRKHRQTQDFHGTGLHLQRPAEGMGSTLSTPEEPRTSAAALKAATNRSSAGETLSVGMTASGGGSSAVRWHAVKCPAASASNCGGSTRQRSMTYGQRV